METMCGQLPTETAMGDIFFDGGAVKALIEHMMSVGASNRHHVFTWRCRRGMAVEVSASEARVCSGCWQLVPPLAVAWHAARCKELAWRCVLQAHASDQVVRHHPQGCGVAVAVHRQSVAALLSWPEVPISRAPPSRDESAMVLERQALRRGLVQQLLGKWHGRWSPPSPEHVVALASDEV